MSNSAKINSFLGGQTPTVSTVSSKSTLAPQGHNEVSTLKAKIMSIVTSMQAMDEEKENIKELLADLKAQHEISPKVARKVAKLIHKAEGLSDLEEEYNAIEQLHQKLTK
jgi:predicted RNase H-like nuclease (RuvC/YqgF family)